jgi:hypothetical protein
MKEKLFYRFGTFSRGDYVQDESGQVVAVQNAKTKWWTSIGDNGKWADDSMDNDMRGFNLAAEAYRQTSEREQRSYSIRPLVYMVS